MFGVSDERLIESLEAIRAQLCCYWGPTCDCKFLGIPADKPRNSEQTGCAEIRQAIKIIQGKRDEVLVLEDARPPSTPPEPTPEPFVEQIVRTQMARSKHRPEPPLCGCGCGCDVLGRPVAPSTPPEDR